MSTRAASFSGDGGRLTIRVRAYERPEARTGSDANWLDGEAELEVGQEGTFAARIPIALRTDELAEFLERLRALYEGLDGEARLAHLEDRLGFEILLTKGRGTMSGFVANHSGTRLDFEVPTDQSHVGLSLQELDGLVATFPVRGDPH